MMNVAEEIYYNLINLNEECEDSEEVNETIDKFYELLKEKLGLAAKRGSAFYDFEKLFFDIAWMEEKQGFIQGFQYAMKLATCWKGGVDCNA